MPKNLFDTTKLIIDATSLIETLHAAQEKKKAALRPSQLAKAFKTFLDETGGGARMEVVAIVTTFEYGALTAQTARMLARLCRRSVNVLTMWMDDEFCNLAVPSYYRLALHALYGATISDDRFSVDGMADLLDQLTLACGDAARVTLVSEAVGASGLWTDPGWCSLDLLDARDAALIAVVGSDGRPTHVAASVSRAMTPSAWRHLSPRSIGSWPLGPTTGMRRLFRSAVHDVGGVAVKPKALWRD